MNRRILFQLTAPSVVVGLLLFLACLVSAWYINRLQTEMSQILAKNVESLVAAQELEISLRQLRFHCFLYVIQPDPALLIEIAQDDAAFENALQRARRTAHAPEELTSVRKIEEGYQSYQREFERLRREADQRGPRRDFLALSEAHPVRLIVEPCRELLKLNQTMMDRSFEESQRLSGRLGFALLLLGVGGPLSGILAGYGVARGFSRSIYQLSVRVQDMAQHLEQEVGSVRLTPVEDMNKLNGQLKHVVTRVAEVAGQLRRQQQELLRAEQLSAVGQLAAGVAHEVRNPLMSVKLLVERAMRSAGRQPLNQRDLEVIHGEVARLERIVEGFLDFARPAAPQRQTADLRELAAAAINLIISRARRQKVHVHCHKPDHPILAEVDRDQMHTVLINLLLNALDAMPEGGSLTVRVGQARENVIAVVVEDTGTGIPAAILERLFTPFTSSKPTGTGLGLSISQRIVQDHGGRLLAANRPGGGASFQIEIPSPAQEGLHAAVAGHR